MPIDRMAWRVVQPGEHYEKPEHLRLLCFDECPPTVWRGHNRRQKQDILTDDYSGLRVGRLTVIGYWGRGTNASKRNQWWACRCLCGLYTVRNARAIANWINGAKKSRALCNACFVAELGKHGIAEQSAIAFIHREHINERGDLDKIYDWLRASE